MRTLLRYFSARYLRRHPFRVFLSVMSVALGVALFASIDVSNSSTEAAFRRTVTALAGKAQLQVVKGRALGVEEEALKKIDGVPGLVAAPVLQLGTTVPGSPDGLLILGLDFNREASFRLWDVAEGEKPQINPLAFLGGDVILISRTFAAKHKLKLGGGFKIDTATGPRGVMIGAIFKDEGPAQIFGGNVAVMPLKTAQRLFRRPGSVDRVEILATGNVEEVARRLREALGPEYTVRPPPQSNSFLDEAMTRLRALLGVGVVALLVGVFIIYNSVSISVVERVREIGTLRAIGATRKQIFGVILFEWSILGLIGSAGGLGLGVGLAKALIRIWTKEVNQVTMVVDVTQLDVLPRTVIGSLVLGTMTTLIAAVFPAGAAMSISPLDMLRQGLNTMRAAGGYFRTFLIGLASLAISLAMLSDSLRFENVGLVASFFAFLGAALIMPQATLWVSKAGEPMLRRFSELLGFLAADNIAKYPQRTALTVIALAGALAMMVSSSSIVTGIKVRSAEWMEDALPFDCTVNSIDYASTLYANAALPEDVPARVQSVEGVDFTYGVRAALQDYGERDIMIFAINMDGYARMQETRGRRGFLLPGTLPGLMSGKGVIVSENFALLHRLKAGDALELATPKGPRRFEILATYEEYAWPQGALYIHRPVYEEQWGDPSLTYLDVKFKAGANRGEVRRRIVEALKEKHSLFVYDVDDLKRVSDSVMDNTLVLMNVQVALAIVIGFFGIVNTLLISVMQRTREIGLLRAVGMTTRQVGTMIVIESSFIALVGAVLGILLGLAGARWPLALHVAQVAGYRLPLYVPWVAVGVALAASVLIGAVASVLPARRAASIKILEAITYE
ncbi:MAG TPA: FtsX-like permease family protein [Planctomycetota bacterium]|nr:FtsX-like permease family protein [Planctomycetota bacterium]